MDCDESAAETDRVQTDHPQEIKYQHLIEHIHDAVVEWRERGDEGPLREVVLPAERALEGIPRVTVAASAAPEIAEGAPVYAPGVIGTEPAPVGDTTPESGSLVCCVTPDGAAVCLGTLVGDASATSGTVVDLERVLV